MNRPANKRASSQPDFSAKVRAMFWRGMGQAEIAKELRAEPATVRRVLFTRVYREDEG